MLQAIPLEGEPVADSANNSPEERATHVLAALEKKAGKPNDLALLSDHLSLLRRWYYRPEKQRIGEIFFANEDGTWPIRKILRGAARMVIGDPRPMTETNREAAKTKILHEGRPDVERTIPVLPRKRKPQGAH
jgi:excinuclease ABC subunit C